MPSMNRRTRLVLPTASVPSMQIFFSSMRCGLVYRGSGRKSDFESDAAIEAAAFFGGLVVERLGGADAAGMQIDGLDSGAGEEIDDEVGALFAEDEIGAFHTGDISVADDIDREFAVQAAGFDQKGANIIGGCGDVVFLAGFELGAPDGEEKH